MKVAFWDAPPAKCPPGGEKILGDQVSSETEMPLLLVGTILRWVPPASCSTPNSEPFRNMYYVVWRKKDVFFSVLLIDFNGYGM